MSGGPAGWIRRAADAKNSIENMVAGGPDDPEDAPVLPEAEAFAKHRLSVLSALAISDHASVPALDHIEPASRMLRETLATYSEKQVALARAGDIANVRLLHLHLLGENTIVPFGSGAFVLARWRNGDARAAAKFFAHVEEDARVVCAAADDPAAGKLVPPLALAIARAVVPAPPAPDGIAQATIRAMEVYAVNRLGNGAAAGEWLGTQMGEDGFLHMLKQCAADAPHIELPKRYAGSDVLVFYYGGVATGVGKKELHDVHPTLLLHTQKTVDLVVGTLVRKKPGALVEFKPESGVKSVWKRLGWTTENTTKAGEFVARLDNDYTGVLFDTPVPARVLGTAATRAMANPAQVGRRKKDLDVAALLEPPISPPPPVGAEKAVSAAVRAAAAAHMPTGTTLTPIREQSSSSSSSVDEDSESDDDEDYASAGDGYGARVHESAPRRRAVARTPAPGEDDMPPEIRALLREAKDAAPSTPFQRAFSLGRSWVEISNLLKDTEHRAGLLALLGYIAA